MTLTVKVTKRRSYVTIVDHIPGGLSSHNPSLSDLVVAQPGPEDDLTDTMSPDTLVFVFSQLDRTSLSRLSLVSKMFRQIANSDSLWQPLVIEHFGQQTLAERELWMSVKELYESRHLGRGGLERIRARHIEMVVLFYSLIARAAQGLPVVAAPELEGRANRGLC